MSAEDVASVDGICTREAEGGEGESEVTLDLGGTKGICERPFARFTQILWDDASGWVLLLPLSQSGNSHGVQPSSNHNTATRVRTARPWSRACRSLRHAHDAH